MTLTALRGDALTTTEDGFALRLGLPWIRSLPLASLEHLALLVDGKPVETLSIQLAHRRIDVGALAGERGWWFLQDRLVVRGAQQLRPGVHDVTVSFHLIVPYLHAGPDGPLTLPFQLDHPLTLDAPAPGRTVSRDVA